jgi:uncharacterized phiE125 gp8 family phage protein
MQNYNHIHDVQDTSLDSPGTVMPVTVTEMKAYMRLEGFDDDLESTATVSFDSDDDLIEEEILAAIERLEIYTGLSFIPKEFRSVVTNLAGGIELERGPIGDINALYYEWDEDYETNSVSDVKTIGNLFKKIKCPQDCKMTIDYSAGYGRPDTEPLPKSLKKAIMAEVLYRFEHRGDELEDDGICKAALRLAEPFKRTKWG